MKASFALLVTLCLAMVHQAAAMSPSGGFAAFEKTLSGQEKAAALISFESADRLAYRLTPGVREGLALMDMDDGTRDAAFELLETALTQRGIEVVRAAIDREARLGKLEGNPEYRHPGKYYLAIFGRPDAGPWGMRFEGHHLSINVTLERDRIVGVTPWLLGANPRELPPGTPDPLLPFLGAQGDAAFIDEVSRMFQATRDAGLLERAMVKKSGFGLWGHPHMEVTAARVANLQ